MGARPRGSRGPEIPGTHSGCPWMGEKVFWVANSRSICSDGRVLDMLRVSGKPLVASTRNGAWRSLTKAKNVCAGLGLALAVYSCQPRQRCGVPG